MRAFPPDHLCPRPHAAHPPSSTSSEALLDELQFLGPESDASLAAGQRPGDSIVISASSIAHLEHNLAAVRQGLLPQEVLDAVSEASESVRPVWPSYYFVL